MRPLLRITVPLERRETRSAYALLMNVFGPYCAISEEPLYDIAYVWNKATNSEFLVGQPPAEDWDNLLLLSPTTREAWKRHHYRPPSELMIPDEQTTFQLEDSPLVYSLETVNLVLTDENDVPLPSPRNYQAVIVSGTTEEARATIETFSLNTEYFDAEGKELRIPLEEFLSREAAILETRTVAWRRATAAADQIAALDRLGRRALVAQLQMSAAATGHWSVWATVLWSRFEDLDLLSSILSGRSEAEKDGDLIGFGPHNEFPGTKPDWLFLKAVRTATA